MNVEKHVQGLVLSFDDIDTLRGGCTTHFATLIIHKFLSNGWKLLDYPYLVRLNPDIPWKTRGNAAVSVILTKEREFDEKDIEKIYNHVQEEIRNYIGSTGPVIGNSQPSFIITTTTFLIEFTGELIDIYNDAVRKTINFQYIEKMLINRLDRCRTCEFKTWSIMGPRGLIGALSSLGYILANSDYTYELLAYTKQLKKLNTDETEKIYNYFYSNEDITTFSNIDVSKRKLLITPVGRDPVLFGLRGDNPMILIHHFMSLRKILRQKIEMFMIFKTNQATSAHQLDCNVTYNGFIPYTQVSMIGYKISLKKVLPNGHYIFNAYDIMREEEVDITCYEESDQVRYLLSSLDSKSVFRIYGNIKKSYNMSGTINMEKIEIISERKTEVYDKPICPNCIVRLERTGVKGPLRCRKCGYISFSINVKLHKNGGKNVYTTVLLEPPRYQRHLTKPLKRYGRESNNKDYIAEKEALNIFLNYLVRR